MVDEPTLKKAEARATQQLRRAGCILTFVWVVGLAIYFGELGYTDSGWHCPTINFRAWSDNVSFLVDWTSLIALSSSFVALLWWPKHVAEILADLWNVFWSRVASHFKPDESPNAPTERTAATDVPSSKIANAPSVPEGRETDATKGSTPPHAHSDGVRPLDAESAAARRRVPWLWLTIFFVALFILVLLLLLFVNSFGDKPPGSLGDKPEMVVEPTPRVYIMREGDWKGAVEAVTHGIIDPEKRARCVEALESDPMNQPPLDRLQRPGHEVVLPDACPTPKV